MYELLILNCLTGQKFKETLSSPYFLGKRLEILKFSKKFRILDIKRCY